MLAAGGMNSQPSGIQLRPGVCELLDTITKSYIPTYVFSSGYGDLVSEVGLIIFFHSYEIFSVQRACF